jgi:hypothetical protein
MHAPARKFQTMAPWTTTNVDEQTSNFGTSCCKDEINFLRSSFGEGVPEIRILHMAG